MTEAVDQTPYLTQSRYTDIWPTSPRADPVTPGVWQGIHYSTHVWVTGMTGTNVYLRDILYLLPCYDRSNPLSPTLKGNTLLPGHWGCLDRKPIHGDRGAQTATTSRMIMEVEVIHAVQWLALQRDTKITPAIVITESMGLPVLCKVCQSTSDWGWHHMGLTWTHPSVCPPCQLDSHKPSPSLVTKMPQRKPKAQRWPEAHEQQVSYNTLTITTCSIHLTLYLCISSLVVGILLFDS